MVNKKNWYRNQKKMMVVPYHQAVAGQDEAIKICLRFNKEHGRWPTINEPRPHSGGMNRIVEHYRRICDAHGVSLFEFLTASTNEDDPVWARLDCPGLTSVKESGAYDGSIAEAMELVLERNPNLVVEMFQDAIR